VITDSYGQKVQTNTVTLTMEKSQEAAKATATPKPTATPAPTATPKPTATPAPLKITTQPVSTKVAGGDEVVLTIKASGEGTLKYQWYYAEADESNFSKSSVTSAIYTVEMNAARNGRRVYCVVSDNYGQKAQTNTVTITMADAIRITAQPKDEKAESGTAASVSVKASGDGKLMYQWYYSDNGGSSFSKSSVTSDTYTVTMDEDRDGRRVYCVITDNYGQSVTSETVTLEMEPLFPEVGENDLGWA